MLRRENHVTREKTPEIAVPPRTTSLTTAQMHRNLDNEWCIRSTCSDMGAFDCDRSTDMHRERRLGFGAREGEKSEITCTIYVFDLVPTAFEVVQGRLDQLQR